MREKAREFLGILSLEAPPTTLADDLLVFFYDLHDHYQIIQSSRPQFSGKSFAFLNDILYCLESRPDETMIDAHWRSFCKMILEDIATGRIIMAKK